MIICANNLWNLCCSWLMSNLQKQNTHMKQFQRHSKISRKPCLRLCQRWVFPYWMIVGANRLLAMIYIGSNWWFQASQLKMMKTFVWKLYIWFDKLLTQASESYQVYQIRTCIMDAKLPTISKNIYTSLSDSLDLTMLVVHEKIMMIWWFYTTIYNIINWLSSKYYTTKSIVSIWKFWMENCLSWFF